MATIGDIKAGLVHGKSEADKALTQLAGVTAQVDMAIAVLQALVAGTRQPAVMGAIGKLTAAKQNFTEGAGLIQAAIAQTEKYNAAL
ncbi:hypothetical protein ABZ807_28920 [Micromonospora sp. NPDC047548]|uniref:hypothetical protein n=1 Tax=Micromonospora sp. NPDC047548 TaxID=3155624 RepID=UPI0033EC99AC